MNSQPKGIYLLIFTQMWERFSFYGMRTLLVLFMIQKLNLGNAEAIGVYALFTTLVNLGGLAGGYLADRILGLRSAVFSGGTLIGIGHLCLSMEGSTSMFFLGLSLIVVGSALFSTNLKALVGQLYEENDPRRGSGFTLFYAGINLGGFLAAVSCGYVAQIYGWHAGFGLAALGMFLGLGVLFKYCYLLMNKGDTPASVPRRTSLVCMGSILALVILLVLLIQNHEFLLPILPMAGLILISVVIYRSRNHEAFQKILSLCGFICLYMGFFVIEDLMGSLLMVFCENKVDRLVGGIEIPSSSLVAMNPLTIIIIGPLLAMMMRRFKTNQQAESVVRMNSFAFMFLGLAFGILYLGTQNIDSAGLVPILYVVICFALIAIGELFIAPTLYSYCSAIAPLALKGQMMGLVVLGRSYASLLSGMLGKAVVTSRTYGESDLFAMTTLVALSLSIILILAINYRRLWTNGQRWTQMDIDGH